MNLLPSSHRDRSGYRVRILVSTAAVLVGCILLIRWWPAPSEGPVPLAVDTLRERVQITMVEQTVQRSEPRPPPPPQAQAPPVEVPDDVILPEEELDLDLSPAQTPGDGETRAGSADTGTAEGASHAARGRPPKPVRLVEPEYTPAARERGVRARIVVRVLVNEEGGVEERQIVERYLADEDTRVLRRVSSIGYGLEESALTAAAGWKFRPGRRDGTPISAYTRVTFSFGL